ncbi:DUF1439 domain-containing protein [Hydrogenophaga sp. PAMC20947]|uniref:DUF1439 domain-containing protein n=1 Tax=Hydrogenophaga sp. PAMC20947 TaxID=2565558 RepID=UPI001445BBB4|nr:DUF1439 domain-containing protein [Hydrogenophaga sp. PAMC20947]
MKQWHRRKLGLTLALVGALAASSVLSACSGMGSGPREVDVSEARLLALVARQFPVQKKYLELFEVSLSEPQLRLMPDENRIGTRLNYAASTVLSSRAPWSGQLELSYGLRYQASDQTVRLDQVRMEGFQLSGAPVSYAQQLRGAGTQIAETMLQDLVVHQFKPEELRRVDGLGYQPGVLKVVPGGLRLQLDPVKR